MKLQKQLLEAVEHKQLRPLDVQFALTVAGDEHPAVTLAAALLSHDAGEGHVCLPLSRLENNEESHPLLATCVSEIGELQNWEECLLASQAVSRGDEPTPMILCGDRLYLNRMWCNERTVARFFNEVNHAIEVDEALLAQTLDKLFPVSDEINWQKVAAAVALTRRISVISGGPGTGKTTTVAKLLAALIQMADGERCRIRLAAPTGKAAARLTESLGKALRQLPLTDEQKKQIAPARTDIIAVYRELQSRRWHAEDLQPLCAKLGEEQTGKTLVAVAALEQVGLITAAEKGGAKFWELVPTAGKKNLADAPILKCLEEL